MRRREFITLLSGAAAGWPLAARAQKDEGIRRVAVLMNTAANEAEAQARLAAFIQGLQEAGWSIGRNVRVDTVWSAGDFTRLYKDAVNLIALRPDVVLAGVGPTVPALQQASKTMPIVFAQGVDPVGAGQVESMAQPGTNATGFVQLDYSLAGKWLELLKEIAPRLKRAAVLRTLATAVGPGQFGAIQAVAPSLRVELRPIDTRDAEQIEHAVVAFASEPNGG